MQMEELREFRNQVRLDEGEKKVIERESGPMVRRARESLEVENSNNTHL